MTATGSRLTAPAAGLLEAVERRYDGGPFTVTAMLEGGWANDVFVLEGGAGAVVLRIKYPPSDPASIGWEHALVGRLARELPEVVAPLRARDGSTFFFYERDAVWLVPFVDAEPAGYEHALEAARLLARLQAVTADLDVPPRPGPDGLAELRSLDRRALPSEWRRRVGPLHAGALDLLRELETRNLLHGVVHGDFFRGNLLVRDGQIVALIDWEESHVAPLVSELANGVWEFTKSKASDDFDREAGARFVAAYRDAGGPVSPAEDDLIVPLIRAKRILELLRAPSDRRVDWEYQAHNLRSAENLR
jgi:Ser/Thr protein kinase RdoA (MazF antagonist)